MYWGKKSPLYKLYVLLMPYKIKSIQKSNFLEDKSFAIYLVKKSKHQQEH